MPHTSVDRTAVAVRSIHIMATGDLPDFQEIIAPDARNHEDVVEPLHCRGRGPGAFHAAALWLRSAFSELAWEVHHAVAEDDLVAVRATMTVRQTGTFVLHGPDGTPVVAFPPRGRSAAVLQTHWFRMQEGEVAEHWADRDDRGMGEQLGWTPPSPLYLLRMGVALRRARRTV